MLTDDIKNIQREIQALKNYAQPMTNLLKQQSVTVNANGSTTGSFSVKFTDGIQHLMWVLPTSTNTILMELTPNPNGVMTQNFWVVDVNAAHSFVVSSFNDFGV